MSNFTHPASSTPTTDNRSTTPTLELLSAEEQVCLRQALDSLICSPRNTTLEAIFNYASSQTTNETQEA